MRRNCSQQNVYKTHHVEKVKEIFGETSAEYGLALCGAAELLVVLKDYTKERFSAMDVIDINNDNEKGRGHVTRARWLVQLGELVTEIEESLGSRPPVAPWFVKK